MIGSEFVSHGGNRSPRSRPLRLVPRRGDAVANEEWYALSKFAKDRAVILVQETEGWWTPSTSGRPFPATYARMHDKGRLYTSFGSPGRHLDESQRSKSLCSRHRWALRNIDADVTPNVEQVTPQGQPDEE